jgi:hypothetical protein
MRYDNNGDVLMACRNGRTRQQLLRSGIHTTDSQVLLLEIYDLLEVTGDTLRTAFPILVPEQTLRIRRIAEQAARKTADFIQPEIEEFLGKLADIRCEKNAYSLLFARIFDGMVWREFGKLDLVRPTRIDVDHPYWAGEVYAFLPRRSFSCGTNTWTEGSNALALNWSREANPLLMPFYGVMRAMDDATLAGILETGAVADDALRDQLSVFGIVDDRGELRIPVLDETGDDPFYQLGRGISEQVADRALALLEPESLKKEFGFRDVQQTLVIVFHEFIWELMETYESRGLVRKPAAFSNPETASPENVSELMFVIRRGPDS